MYRIKKEKSEMIKKKYKGTWLAEKLGVSAGYVSQIINYKLVSKMIAYCFTKALDENFEIDDVFDKSEGE